MGPIPVDSKTREEEILEEANNLFDTALDRFDDKQLKALDKKSERLVQKAMSGQKAGASESRLGFFSRLLSRFR